MLHLGIPPTYGHVCYYFVEGLAVDLADLAFCSGVNKGPGLQLVFIDLMLIAFFTG